MKRVTVQERSGLNLLEICIAVTVMAFAMIPIYSHISRQTAIAIHTEKIQMADHLLESIKEELTGMPYANLYEFAKNVPKDDLGYRPLEDGMYPLTNVKVLEIQKKFKDYTVTGRWKFLERPIPGGVDTSMTQVEARVAWTTETSDKKERTRTFMLIAPR